MEKVVRKVTFKEAERLDIEFWAQQSVQAKWKILTGIRKEFNGENSRLARTITVLKKDSKRE